MLNQWQHQEFLLGGGAVGRAYKGLPKRSKMDNICTVGALILD